MTEPKYEYAIAPPEGKHNGVWQMCTAFMQRKGWRVVRRLRAPGENETGAHPAAEQNWTDVDELLTLLESSGKPCILEAADLQRRLLPALEQPWKYVAQGHADNGFAHWQAEAVVKALHELRANGIRTGRWGR